MREMKQGPNEYQQKWLKCLKRLQTKLDREPTLEEWGEAMGKDGTKGKNAAQRMSDMLERDGYLKVRHIFKRVFTAKGEQWL